MPKVSLHFTGEITEYGFVAETGLGTPMCIESLIMPEGYIPDIVAPDGKLFKVFPDKMQQYIAPNIGDVLVFLTLIVDDGMMKGKSIDVRDEKIYMSKVTAQQYNLW